MRERAGAEVCSLISEGYRRVVSSERRDLGRGIITLRHRDNGNVITVRWSEFMMWVVKNGKVVKSEGRACVGVVI